MEQVRAENGPKLSLPADSELDSTEVSFLATARPFNVLRMLARTGIVHKFVIPLGAMFDPDWFPVEDREIILFRTCRANRSDYEIPQHRVISGIATETVDAILDDRLDELTDWQRRLCQLADAVSIHAKLTLEQTSELVDHYGSENVAARAILIMSWFNMLTRFVDSTGVQLETGPDPCAGIGSRGPVDYAR